jgi:peptidoglycan hydrolase-like protein with peptidoglycan-binding domain
MTLHQGSSGQEVRELQEKLQHAGFDPGNVDGEFGHNTEHAVLAFQNAASLTADGIAGPHTMQALDTYLSVSAHRGTPALDVWYQELDSSCEWVTFTVYNSGDGEAAANSYFSWITVQPEHSGHAVWTYRDELPAIPAGQQVYSTIRLPDSLDNGNYDVHVGILDANNGWVTQQPHVVHTTVHDRRFAAR